MLRSLPACLILLAVPALCRAQADDKETVIRLKVQAAAAPQPALKYLLLPELREMNPGNPIQAYMKCFMEQNEFFFSKQSEEDREKWLQTPLKDLPVKQLRGYGGIALRQADEAARLDSPDWQTLLQMRRDGILLLVPEVQQMRTLARSLVVRLRGDVADRRFDDAVVSAKTLFALARHLGEHPTLIAGLVGIAIAHMGIGPLEEMLAQPGCPNLYWGLAQLPTPLIDLRRGMQGERMLLSREFAPLDSAEPMSEVQLQKAIKLARELLSLGNFKLNADVADWVAAAAKNDEHVAAARRRLIAYGLAENAVNKFPPTQVVLLDEKRAYEIERDEVTKAIVLPSWQAEPILAGLKRGKREDALYAWVVPAVGKVHLAYNRIEQRLALLRCVEALRLHAADNDGKLPATLADVKVPLPLDPFTGKAFAYKLDGQTGILRGTPPRGMKDVAAYNVRYEIIIAK